MSNLGLGVMIGYLGGNKDTVDAVQSSLGKSIAAAAVDDDKLILGFDDGAELCIWDAGQSCCEYRHMDTDDDPLSIVGDKLVSIETRDAPGMDDGDNCHDVQFLVVTTDKGTLTCATHNEHNGYYGGFLLKAALRQPSPPAGGGEP